MPNKQQAGILVSGVLKLAASLLLLSRKETISVSDFAILACLGGLAVACFQRRKLDHLESIFLCFLALPVAPSLISNDGSAWLVLIQIVLTELWEPSSAESDEWVKAKDSALTVVALASASVGPNREMVGFLANFLLNGCIFFCLKHTLLSQGNKYINQVTMEVQAEADSKVEVLQEIIDSLPVGLLAAPKQDERRTTVSLHGEESPQDYIVNDHLRESLKFKDQTAEEIKIPKFHSKQFAKEKKIPTTGRIAFSLLDLAEEQENHSSTFYVREPSSSKTTFEIRQARSNQWNILCILKVDDLIEASTQAIQSYYQEALTATMSHEQLNPLNSIINFTDILQLQTEEALKSVDGSSSDDSDRLVGLEQSTLTGQLKALRIIKSSSSLMQLLNSGMLNLALLKQDKLEVEHEQISNMHEMLVRFTGLFEEHTQQKNLKLIIEKNVQGTRQMVSRFMSNGVLLNSALYMQILYNVFMNACKFNKQEGEIKIKLSIRPKLNRLGDDLARKSNGIELTTTIQDSGVGMSRDQLDKLFTLFSDISSSKNRNSSAVNLNHKSNSSGVGLGLYLSRSLAQFLDGDIKISSNLNAGTKVDIILPLHLGSGADRSIFSISEHPDNMNTEHPSTSPGLLRDLFDSHRRSIFCTDQQMVKNLLKQDSFSEREQIRRIRSSSIDYRTRILSGKIFSKSNQTSPAADQMQVIKIEEAREVSSDSSLHTDEDAASFSIRNEDSSDIAQTLAFRASNQSFSLFSQDEQEMPPLSEAMMQFLNVSFDAKTLEGIERIESNVQNLNDSRPGLNSSFNVSQIEEQASFTNPRGGAFELQLQLDLDSIDENEERSELDSPDSESNGEGTDQSQIRSNHSIRSQIIRKVTHSITCNNEFMKFGTPKARKEGDDSPKRLFTECSTILIVEDNSFNQEALKMMIQGALKSSNLDTANDGVEGFQAFKSKTEQAMGGFCMCGKSNCPNKFYKVIFMDINMPNMDGIECSRLITEYVEENPSAIKPYIVALTAYSGKEFEDKSKKVGMDEFLNKPAKKPEVISAILKKCPEMRRKSKSVKSVVLRKSTFNEQEPPKLRMSTFKDYL